MKEQVQNESEQNAKTNGIALRSGLRTGEATNLGEVLFFGLLDALQQPTDWLYDKLTGNKPA